MKWHQYVLSRRNETIPSLDTWRSHSTRESLIPLTLVLPLCCFWSSDLLIVFFSTDLQLPLALFHPHSLLLLTTYFSDLPMCTHASKGRIREYTWARHGEYLRCGLACVRHSLSHFQARQPTTQSILPHVAGCALMMLANRQARV